MESPDNIRGQTAEEQIVGSCRIEFEDPGMQQEKETCSDNVQAMQQDLDHILFGVALRGMLSSFLLCDVLYRFINCLLFCCH
jgi:hypothetical protein